jgi:hypothetical protein
MTSVACGLYTTDCKIVSEFFSPRRRHLDIMTSEGSAAPPAQPRVFQEDGRAITAHTARRQRLAPARTAPGHTWRVPPVVRALQPWRGVQCTVAVSTGAARGALTRVETPRPRLTCLGLLPSESARGARRRPRSLITAGPTPARRALVAGTWADRSPATVRRHLPRRLAQHPKALQALSWTVHGRGCTRDRCLMARGRPATP